MRKKIEDKDRLKKLIEYYERQGKTSLEAARYSNQRFDYIIIAVSMASIFFTTNLIKDYDLIYCSCSFWFKVSIMLFSVTILSNIIGQAAAYKLHSKKSLAHRTIHENLKMSEEHDEEWYGEQIEKAEKMSPIIVFTNKLSILSFCFAIVLSCLAYLVFL